MHHIFLQQPTPEQTEMALFDLETPTSFANLCPKGVFDKLKAAFDGMGEFTSHIHDEQALAETLKEKTGFTPSIADQRVRYLLWQEYESAIIQHRKMRKENFYSLVCTENLFNRMLNHEPRCMWLLCKPPGYAEVTGEMLLHGMKHQRKILDYPDFDPTTGKMNTKLMELKLKITAMLDMRIHGSPMQKIQQLNLSANLNASDSREVKELIKSGDMEAIRKRIHEIESEKKKLEGQVDSDQDTIEVLVEPRQDITEKIQ